MKRHLECDGVWTLPVDGSPASCDGTWILVESAWLPPLSQADVASLVGAIVAFWAVCLVFRWVIVEVRNRA